MLQPLAQHYLDESRQGAQLISSEQKRILATTLADLRSLVKTASEQRNQTLLLLPWVHIKGLSIPDLEVGYKTQSESNVAAPLGNVDLLSFDRENKLVDQDTNLYYGNVHLKLPVPDDDLDFKLSSLPAPVEETVSPARIESGGDFITVLRIVDNGKSTIGACEYLPSATRVTFAQTFTSCLAMKIDQPIATRVCGTTNGASPLP